LGLKDFLNKKLITEPKENNQQKKEAQQAGKKEFFKGYESEQKKIQSQKGREQARRDAQGFGGKIGAFANAFGESSRNIEKSFGFEKIGFGYPPVEKQSRQKKKKEHRHHQPNSLDYTDW
jgi:hypothetical protein